MALLTGPARGYVKKKLKDYGIPFVHEYPSNHNDLKSYYHAFKIIFSKKIRPKFISNQLYLR